MRSRRRRAVLAGKGEGERTHVGLARSASGLAAVKRSTNSKPSLPAAAGSHLREGTLEVDEGSCSCSRRR
jgi:hypothetical protein